MPLQIICFDVALYSARFFPLDSSVLPLSPTRSVFVAIPKVHLHCLSGPFVSRSYRSLTRAAPSRCNSASVPPPVGRLIFPPRPPVRRKSGLPRVVHTERWDATRLVVTPPHEVRLDREPSRTRKGDDSQPSRRDEVCTVTLKTPIHQAYSGFVHSLLPAHVSCRIQSSTGAV